MSAIPTPSDFRRRLMFPIAGGARPFDAVLADFQRRDFEVLDRQFMAVACGEKPTPRRAWIERTKGASKDTDLATLILWLLAFSQRPVLCQAAAADFEQAAELRKAAGAILKLNPWLDRVITVQAGALLNPTTDSRLDILTADAVGSHGARPDVLVCNELSHVADREFVETLFDNLEKMPGGLGIIATNAGALGSWVWQWREEYKGSDDCYFSTYDKPAPWIDAKGLERRRKTSTPLRYQRYWEGKWTASEGDALDEELIDAALAAGVRPSDRADSSFVYVGGLDLGLRRDKSALAVVGTHRRTGRYQLFALKTWTPTKRAKVSIEQVGAEIVRVNKVFRFAKLLADPWQGHLLNDLLKKAGVRSELYSFTPANLDSMGRHFINLFGEGLVDLPDLPGLISQLRSTVIIERPNGQMRLQWPRNEAGHGDSATALMLALWAGRDAVGQVVFAPPYSKPAAWSTRRLLTGDF